MDELIAPSVREATSEQPVASQLRAIWSELLYLDSIGDHDNFVELGGDSIAATLCTIRIEGTFGVDLDVSFVLQDDADFSTMVSEIETRIGARSSEDASV